MARDPVCGMNIDETTAAGKSKYGGTVYFFCAPGCLREFMKDPEKYLAGRSTSRTKREKDSPQTGADNGGHH